MSGPEEDSLLEAWRRGWAFPRTVLPYALLAALTASATTPQWGSVRVNLILCAVAAVWMLIPLRPAWRDRIWLMAVFMAGFFAIAAVLVVRDPWFGFFAGAGYGYSFRLMPWPWTLRCVGMVGVLAATSQMWSVNKDTPAGLGAYLAVIVMNVAGVCGVAWFVHGLLRVNDQRKRALGELSEANRRLEATVAENAGLHRQLLIQAREAGIQDERQRMAREIHDTLAQGLTGIITQLQAAEHAADEPAEWRGHFAAATRLARESLSEARRSVDALRPEPLETGRLSDALADIASRWSELHGIEATVMTTGPARPVRPEAEVALLRTAQEALANVAKHAGATRVGVTLSYLDQEVAVDVRDDGRGFDPALLRGGAVRGHPGGSAPAGSAPAGSAPGADGGFGLVAMRQRIEALSGALRIESEPGAGTAISARVPADEQARPLEVRA
jgi:signal transduction histidine kinase